MATVAVLRALWSAGDWAALVPVLQPHAKRCAVRALNGMLDVDDYADDIAQESVVRCWRAARVPDDPMAFVGRVARNLALDTWKRGQYRIEVRNTGADDLALQAIDDTPDALSVLMQEESVAAMRQALDRLPEQFRDPLVKRVFEDRTVQSIADESGIKHGALKMRLTRARRALAVLTDLPNSNR